MKIYCRVTDYGLIPMYDSDYDEKKRLKVGDTVLCEIKRPRNYEFLKKFMALVRLTFDNLPEHLHDLMGIYSTDDMLTSLKFDLDFVPSFISETATSLKKVASPSSPWMRPSSSNSTSEVLTSSCTATYGAPTIKHYLMK